MMAQQTVYTLPDGRQTREWREVLKYLAAHPTETVKSNWEESLTLDAALSGTGYKLAEQYGLLAEYMEMMNCGGSGGYSEAIIAKARSGANR